MGYLKEYNMKEYCDRCISHHDRIERNEMDIEKLTKSIDTIKVWIILAMSAVLIQLLVFVFGIFLKQIKVG